MDILDLRRGILKPTSFRGGQFYRQDNPDYQVHVNESTFISVTLFFTAKPVMIQSLKTLGLIDAEVCLVKFLYRGEVYKKVHVIVEDKPVGPKKFTPITVVVNADECLAVEQSYNWGMYYTKNKVDGYITYNKTFDQVLCDTLNKLMKECHTDQKFYDGTIVNRVPDEGT